MSDRTEVVHAGVLATAYVEDGPPDGWPVVLAHGFPYDVHAYDEVVPHLTARGARVVRPYLRGHGPTRFLSAATLRSGQQAALGSDLLALLDALGLEAPIVAGYDWGGLSSCVVAALWPERPAPPAPVADPARDRVEHHVPRLGHEDDQPRHPGGPGTVPNVPVATLPNAYPRRTRGGRVMVGR